LSSKHEQFITIIIITIIIIVIINNIIFIISFDVEILNCVCVCVVRNRPANNNKTIFKMFIQYQFDLSFEVFELTSPMGLCAGKLEACKNKQVNIVLFFSFFFFLLSFLPLYIAPFLISLFPPLPSQVIPHEQQAGTMPPGPLSEELPINISSISRAAWRPSAMAHTINDWPRRQSELFQRDNESLLSH